MSRAYDAALRLHHKQLQDDGIIDEDGILRPGKILRVPMYMRDSATFDATSEADKAAQALVDAKVRAEDAYVQHKHDLQYGTQPVPVWLDDAAMAKAAAEAAYESHKKELADAWRRK